MVQASNVRKQVVQPVRVRRRLFCVPELGVGELLVESTFSLRFIINAIKPNYTLEENVKFGMGCRVLGHFKKRLEDI